MKLRPIRYNNEIIEDIIHNLYSQTSDFTDAKILDRQLGNPAVMQIDALEKLYELND